MMYQSLLLIILARLIITLLPHLLPYGPAVDIPKQHQPAISKVDPTNISLQMSEGRLTKIYERFDNNDEDDEQKERLLTLPETILFDNNGIMYIMNNNAKLVSLTDFQQSKQDDNIMTAKTTEVADLGVGRPLGGKFDKNTCLYYADAILGLARICNINQSSTNKSYPEIVATRVKLSNGKWSPINYTDDVDIGPHTGHVYFSDASDVKTDRDTNSKWDIEYSSKIEGIRGKRSGRILRYKPETGEVDILADGAAFANGVAVDKDEMYILYTSTFEGCVMKYYLQGSKKGTAERILDNLPGFLDGADCSFKSGLCYVAIPTPISGLVQTIFALPPWMSKAVRTLLMIIPRTWAPRAEAYGAVAEIDPGRGERRPKVVRTFQDPSGKDIQMLTGVTEHDGKVYLGSLHNNHIGVLTLD